MQWASTTRWRVWPATDEIYISNDGSVDFQFPTSRIPTTSVETGALPTRETFPWHPIVFGWMSLKMSETRRHTSLLSVARPCNPSPHLNPHNHFQSAMKGDQQDRKSEEPNCTLQNFWAKSWGFFVVSDQVPRIGDRKIAVSLCQTIQHITSCTIRKSSSMVEFCNAAMPCMKLQVQYFYKITTLSFESMQPHNLHHF